MRHHGSLGTRGTLALALGVLLVAAPHAEAQRWGRPRTPQAGACFYRNANYRGDYFCVPAGEALERMPSGLNDKISSIRTFGAVEVLVFRNPGFGGRSNRFRGDISNLQQEGWNDTLSSLQVRRSGFGAYGRNDDRRDGWNDGRNNGGGYGDRGAARDVDRIIARVYQDLLDRDPDPAGLREYRRRMLDDGWSEGDVREAIRRSPEYRDHRRRRPPV